MRPDPSLAEIAAAALRLAPVALRTPLRRSGALSAIAGGDVWLKCEHRQRTGSYKVRGAFNQVSLLPPEIRARGVVAASAGNHGLGVAFAAAHFGIEATIFIPFTAPQVKRRGIEQLGARINDGSASYDDALGIAERWAAERGATFLKATSGAELLAGAGTIAMEILADLPEVRSVVVPVGGGGLLGGTGSYLRAAAPHVRIIGALGDRTPAMARALAAGRVVEVPVVPTLADGLAGQIDEEGLRIGRAYLDDLVEVREQDIASAIAWLHREEHEVVEGSGAVGAAAVRAGLLRAAANEERGTRRQAAGSGGAAGPASNEPGHALPVPAVLLLSGGNIDPARHAEVVRLGEG